MRRASRPLTTTEKGRGYAFEKVAGPMRRAAVGAPCPRCRVTMGTGRRNPAAATVDHILPLRLGGTNDVWNLRVVCLSCNCKLGSALGARIQASRRLPRTIVQARPSRQW
jgi:5-methylcytosine-specific restriction endonuclease McrA